LCFSLQHCFAFPCAPLTSIYIYLFTLCIKNKEGDLTNVRIHLEVHVCMIVPSIGRQYVNLEVYHNFRENRFIDFVTFLSACPLLFVKVQDSSLHLNRWVSSKTFSVIFIFNSTCLTEHGVCVGRKFVEGVVFIREFFYFVERL
jgi:hypothetical protein